MGLDMYLEAEIYIGSGKLNGTVENADGSKVNLPDMPISYLKYDVAYWCKAYAIQSWFFTTWVILTTVAVWMFQLRT